jgi:hypothetical protein
MVFLILIDIEKKIFILQMTLPDWTHPYPTIPGMAYSEIKYTYK